MATRRAWLSSPLQGRDRRTHVQRRLSERRWQSEHRSRFDRSQRLRNAAAKSRLRPFTRLLRSDSHRSVAADEWLPRLNRRALHLFRSRQRPPVVTLHRGFDAPGKLDGSHWAARRLLLRHNQSRYGRASRGRAYNIRPANTVLSVSYARTMETPFNENLILLSLGATTRR